MNYGLTQKPSLTTNECLVLGIFSDTDLPDFAQTLIKNTMALLQN